MSNNKIKTLYVCPVCHYGYKTHKAAEACLRSHKPEITYRRIQLGFTLSPPGYNFFSSVFRKNDGDILNTKADAYGFYNGYPAFMTECINNEADILAAKKRLIEAAYEWADKYREVLAGVERELEAGND